MTIFPVVCCGQVTGIDVNAWFQMIGSIVQKALPEASEGLEPLGQPTLPEERKVRRWWCNDDGAMMMLSPRCCYHDLSLYPITNI